MKLPLEPSILGTVNLVVCLRTGCCEIMDGGPSAAGGPGGGKAGVAENRRDLLVRVRGFPAALGVKPEYRLLPGR